MCKCDPRTRTPFCMKCWPTATWPEVSAALDANPPEHWKLDIENSHKQKQPLPCREPEPPGTDPHDEKSSVECEILRERVAKLTDVIRQLKERPKRHCHTCRHQSHCGGVYTNGRNCQTGTGWEPEPHLDLPLARAGEIMANARARRAHERAEAAEADANESREEAVRSIKARKTAESRLLAVERERDALLAENANLRGLLWEACVSLDPEFNVSLIAACAKACGRPIPHSLASAPRPMRRGRGRHDSRQQHREAVQDLPRHDDLPEVREDAGHLPKDLSRREPGQLVLHALSEDEHRHGRADLREWGEMIITDGVHLVSTISEEELHNFAASLGFPRRWYQINSRKHGHYDLTTKNAVRRALAAGAKKLTAAELVKLAWWAKR